MATTSRRKSWALEVVRGRDVGRRYAIGAGETTLGNGSGTAPHVDLSDQEGASARRMSGRQAVLVATDEGLSVRDLDSPGGTFVNRQRLLGGQQRALLPGDVVQLGGVQLRVTHEAADGVPVAYPPEPVQPLPSRGGPPAVSYTFSGGAVCRTWDDFLTLSAQSWAMVRDELASGRITEHLRRTHRAELAPRSEPGRSLDEVLDAWLGRLPTTRPSAPELDVHPTALVVRSASTGGVVRQTLRIANVGYRILRSTVHVETSTPGRLRLSPDLNGKPVLTIDATDLGVEIELPEEAGSSDLGTIVIASNGGARRVAVRVERPSPAPFAVEPSAPPIESVPTASPLASTPMERRLWLFPAVLVGFRLLVESSNRLSLGLPPGLTPSAAAAAALGFLLGAALGVRGGSPLDAAASGFVGAVGGLLASALAFAVIQTVEPAGESTPSIATLMILWGVIGVALALASAVAFPRRSPARPEEQK